MTRALETTRARALGLMAVALVVSACSESPTSPSSPLTGGSSPTTATSSTPPSSTPSTTSTNPTTTGASASPTSGHSLRFHGNGSAEVDLRQDPDRSACRRRHRSRSHDRVLAEGQTPGDNTSATCQAGSDGWTYGNAILDRDVAGDGDFGEYGVSLSGGRIAFGVGRAGRSQTICGLIDVADGRWHHVALTRRSADGQMRVYVDGTESGQGVGPIGDISYRDGRPTAAAQDPYLILGAAKQEATESRQGFAGWIDELRLSTKLRYTVPFDRPTGAFIPDAETALLFHFDEGPAGPCASTVVDTSGRAVHGQCRHGGDATPGPAYATDVPFNPEPARTQRTWLLGNEPGLKPADRGRSPGRSAGGRRRPPRIVGPPTALPFWPMAFRAVGGQPSSPRADRLAPGGLAGTRSAGSTTTRAIGCTNPRRAHGRAGKITLSRPSIRAFQTFSESEPCRPPAARKVRVTSPLPRRPSSRR